MIILAYAILDYFIEVMIGYLEFLKLRLFHLKLLCVMTSKQTFHKSDFFFHWIVLSSTSFHSIVTSIMMKLLLYQKLVHINNFQTSKEKTISNFLTNFASHDFVMKNHATIVPS